MKGWDQAAVDALNAQRGAKLPAHLPPQKAARAKYGNQKTERGGILYDSKREADYGLLLSTRQRLKEIDSLERQPAYELYVEREGVRIHCGWFTPDFQYWTRSPDMFHVDEVKSKITKTTAYQLRKRWAEALYGFRVTEVF